MMQEILNYLENSALIANVISFVVLGATGVLLRSIFTAIARITEQNKDIAEKQGLIKNLASIAQITYQTSLMYKNAIINSNLTPEAKNQALEIFNEIDKAYKDLVPQFEEIQEAIEEKTSAVTEELVQQFTQVGQDALSKLRDKLK
jgi:DNA-binding ferritin-like protein